MHMYFWCFWATQELLCSTFSSPPGMRHFTRKTATLSALRSVKSNEDHCGRGAARGTRQDGGLGGERLLCQGGPDDPAHGADVTERWAGSSHVMKIEAKTYLKTVLLTTCFPLTKSDLCPQRLF